MKLSLSSTLFALSVLSATAQFDLKKNSNTEPYPYGNPVITHMYTADAAPKVMPDGRLWMVTSVDHEEGGGYSRMHAIHAFSTADMVNWVDHGCILHLDDLGEKEGEDWAIWAPDIIYRDGIYYLYYPMRNLLKDGTIERYVAVAESDRMDQKFTVTNPRMAGVPRAGLDPSVFIDDDGVAYLYWNQALMGLLREDMRDIEGDYFKLDIGTTNFMEAAWMHKRDGKYYYNYHTKYDKKVDPENPDDPQRRKSRLDYSMGDSPTGPLTYMGPINYELGVGVENGPKLPGRDYVPWRLTQSNHGAVVEYHGQEYFFYHTSALSSWRQDRFEGSGTWTQRSVCVDYLNYREDGSVIPVKQTVEGVAAVEIDQPFEIVLQDAPVQITEESQVYFFSSVNLGTGYYYFDLNVDKLDEPVRAEIRKGAVDGPLMGTLLIKKEGIVDTFLRGASGIQDIHIVFDAPVQVSKLRFFAGAPTILK